MFIISTYISITFRLTIFEIRNALFWLCQHVLRRLIFKMKKILSTCAIYRYAVKAYELLKLFPIYGVFLKYFKGRSISIKVLKLVLKWCVKRENSLQGVNCIKWPELLLSDMKYWNNRLGIYVDCVEHTKLTFVYEKSTKKFHINHFETFFIFDITFKSV